MYDSVLGFHCLFIHILQKKPFRFVETVLCGFFGLCGFHEKKRLRIILILNYLDSEMYSPIILLNNIPVRFSDTVA